MFNIGTSELILILILVLIVFGPNKIPELARVLGSGVREFKRATQEMSSRVNHALDEKDDEAEKKE